MKVLSVRSLDSEICSNQFSTSGIRHREIFFLWSWLISISGETFNFNESSESTTGPTPDLDTGEFHPIDFTSLWVICVCCRPIVACFTVKPSENEDSVSHTSNVFLEMDGQRGGAPQATVAPLQGCQCWRGPVKSSQDQEKGTGEVVQEH